MIPGAAIYRQPARVPAARGVEGIKDSGAILSLGMALGGYPDTRHQIAFENRVARGVPRAILVVGQFARHHHCSIGRIGGHLRNP